MPAMSALPWPDVAVSDGCDGRTCRRWSPQPDPDVADRTFLEMFETVSAGGLPGPDRLLLRVDRGFSHRCDHALVSAGGQLPLASLSHLLRQLFATGYGGRSWFAVPAEATGPGRGLLATVGGDRRDVRTVADLTVDGQVPSTPQPAPSTRDVTVSDVLAPGRAVWLAVHGPSRHLLAVRGVGTAGTDRLQIVDVADHVEQDANACP